MKRHRRIATVLSLGALSASLCFASVSSAQPEPQPEEKPTATEEGAEEEGAEEEEGAKEDGAEEDGTEEDAPDTKPEKKELTAEERAALKAEIKAEVKAELQAEKEAAAAAEAKKAKAKAEAEKKPKPPEKENPLLPDGQKAALGKHPIANDKNTYKPGSGMHLESEDGAFGLTTRLRAQIRQEIVGARSGGDTELSQVFQIRRARLQFKGHAFDEHNKLKVELAFSPRDLGMKNGVPHNTPLLTWYFEFDYLRDLTIRMGQYKIPFSRQRVTSSGDLQLVDRSIANGEFNEDRDIGFDLRSNDVGGLGGYLRYYAGVYMGEGRDFGDKNATPDFKLHYLGRIEVLPMGDFKDYKEADIERNLTPKLSLGATYSFHHDAQRLRGVIGDIPDDEGTTNYHSVVADYAFKYYGFSSVGEFHWRKGKRKAGSAMVEDDSDPPVMVAAPVNAARNGVGWHVQMGYLFPRTPFEIAARYSGIRGIGDEDPGDLVAGNTRGFTSLGREDSVGGGLSYYFAGHPWKLQADYFHTWEDGDQDEGEDMFRLQLQLAY